MKVRLMNSAMMPKEGVYRAVKITKQEFIKEIKEAYNKGILESYIGYENNVELIKKWTGITVELRRVPTTVEDGDVLLVLKLKYRVQNPSQKGKFQPSEEDYEFYKVYYSEG